MQQGTFQPSRHQDQSKWKEVASDEQVCVKADYPDAVANGVLQILAKLSEETGKVAGGEWEVEDGGARVFCSFVLLWFEGQHGISCFQYLRRKSGRARKVHFIVPTSAARNIIGKGPGITAQMPACQEPCREAFLVCQVARISKPCGKLPA